MFQVYKSLIQEDYKNYIHNDNTRIKQIFLILFISKIQFFIKKKKKKKKDMYFK